MTATHNSHDRQIVSGSLQPSRYWWQGGQVTLRTASGEWRNIKTLLPPEVEAVLSIETPTEALTDFCGLFTFLEFLQTEEPTIQLAENLQLLGHVWRLALEIVREEDILPFLSATSMETKDFVSQLVGTTESTEDDWALASGLHPHVAMWLPRFTDSYVLALRRLYVCLANNLFASDWQPSTAWKQENHGQTLVDVWLCYCVDQFVQRLQENTGDSTFPATESAARLPYRGEQELMSNWQAQLNSGKREPFAADSWLVWRLVKKTFANSGWTFENMLDDSGASTWHLEMELVPPLGDAPGGDWRLVYFLAHNHWNQRLSLQSWWRQSNRKVVVGCEYLLEPDSWFLPRLRQAGEVSAAIHQSLRQQAPYEAVVAPNELLALLYEQLPQLHQLGITVKSPRIDALESKDIRIRVQVKRNRNTPPKTSQSSRAVESWFDAKQLVDFDWSLVVGDLELSKEQFQEMVAEHSPYIELNGTWRLVPIQEILKQIRTFEGLSQDRRETNLLQFSRVLALDEEDGVPVDISYGLEAASAERWMDALRHAQEPVLLPAPAGFNGTLRQYQEKGFSWLVHLRQLGLGGCLADDMGLGKTIQVLAYFMYLKEQHLTRGTHLLVCPTSLLQNWRSEMQRFTPGLTVHIHHGSQRNMALASGELPIQEAVRNVDVVMTTYATLVRDMESLSQIQWDAVVADEAQNVKNTETKQAGAIRQLSTFHAIALTGTPVENRLEELWSIMDFVNPGYLGNLNWFRREFAGKIQQEPAGPAAKRIQVLLRPVLLRRRKTDAAIQVELPEKWEVREYAGLTAEQAALYQSIVNRLWSGISSAAQMSRRGQILAALVRLKQVCDHPCLVMGGSNQTARSAKLKMLLDLIEDVTDEEDSCLIFTQFRDMGELIRDAVESRFGWRPQFLHGGLSAAARGEIVRNFQEGVDKSPVLVLSLKAGGVGLNLTRANHVFHFDRWWNPAVEDQATDRAFRIGQTKDVQVHKLVCSGTLEERIDELITAKRTLSAAIVGESEAWLTEMDDGELRSLFALDVEAAMEVDE